MRLDFSQVGQIVLHVKDFDLIDMFLHARHQYPQMFDVLIEVNIRAE